MCEFRERQGRLLWPWQPPPARSGAAEREDYGRPYRRARPASGGRLFWCLLYYSRTRRSDLATAPCVNPLLSRHTILRTSWPGETSYVLEGRAPEKGAATEARPCEVTLARPIRKGEGAV